VKGPKAKFTSIDQYIGEFPAEVQVILEEVRKAIQKAAPQASEKISYGIPTFYLNGNLVHFAAWKNHIGFYPTSSGVSAFQEELSRYKQSRGAIQFPIDDPLPLKLITRIVKFRVLENSKKKS
jgi:uncharacterized protein YdhG (YjbR/CyaY superfamily)